MARVGRVALLLCGLALTLGAGCDDRAGAGHARPGAGARVVAAGSGSAVEAPGAPVAVPPPDDEERLVQAHHLQWVTGDLPAARQVLAEVASRAGGPRALRATAELRLADLDETVGDRRGALGHLERAKSLAGSDHPLALEADDRRARILTVTPLADVRGPVPGSVTLKHEPGPVLAKFRRAEQLLAAFHRVIVAPQLENMNEVLRTKRRALAAAVAAYQEVAAAGGTPAKVAALFRMGAMHHHLAEALAFAAPPELLPSVARHLRRQLQAESTAHLRKSLTYYQSAAELKGGAALSPWRELAEREEKTLEVVLRPGTGRKRGR